MNQHDAIYVRISRDSTGEGLGVARQTAECHALRKRLSDLTDRPVIVYSDNDLTAARKKGRRAQRPQFDAMVAAVKAGEVHAVLAWDLDRLFRDISEQEDFLIMAEQSRLARISTVGDDIDISSGDFLVARIKAAVAADEIRKIRKRGALKAAELKARGIYVGRYRPFGHDRTDEPGVLTLNEAEADALRMVVGKVLAGQSGESCANWLNAEGFTTTTGRPWTGTALNQTLRAARIAGLMERDGRKRDLTGEYDIVGEGAWPAIVDEPTWRAMLAVMADRVRGPIVNTPDEQTRPYWASAVTVCAECGRKLQARPARVNGVKVRRYSCFKARGGCGTVGIHADHYEALVVDLIRDRLTDPMFGAVPQAEDPALDPAAIADVKARLAQVEDDHYLGLLERDRYLDLRATLSAKLKSLTPKVTVPTLPALTSLDAFDAAWPTMEGDQRAAVAQAVFARLTVRKATPGIRFDPERVTASFAA